MTNPDNAPTTKFTGDTNAHSTAENAFYSPSAVAIVGNWSGDYGQHFVAWSPLPQRDKNQETSLGVLEL